MMQILLDSIKIVTSATGFWLFIGSIISLGMVVGARLNEGRTGFKRSIIIIIPFVVILLSTNLSRVLDYARINGFGGQSFTNIFSLLFVAVAYTIGLFIGHIWIGFVLKPFHKRLDELETERQNILKKI